MTDTALEDFDGWSPQGPVTELSAEHAWSRLRSMRFGRLGVSLNDQPEIFPVDYVVDSTPADGATILFRTAAGTKLSELRAHRAVVFEVDERTAGSAWSVTVKGNARVLTDDEEIAAAGQAPLPPWQPVLRYVFVRIAPDSVRGRSFQHHVRAVRVAR